MSVESKKRWFMQFSLPPQITRLSLLTVGIIVAYSVARHFLVPVSFGQYGWYRGHALKELTALPLNYAGREACAECHPEIVKEKAESKHKTVACESCHGPSRLHTEDPGVSPEKIVDPRFCLRCHEENPARPEQFPTVNAKDHSADQDCMECHKPHAPEEFPST